MPERKVFGTLCVLTQILARQTSTPGATAASKANSCIEPYKTPSDSLGDLGETQKVPKARPTELSRRSAERDGAVVDRGGLWNHSLGYRRDDKREGDTSITEGEGGWT